MAAERRSVPGIFCLEGEWSAKLTDRASVRSMLEMLESVERIRFIHEHVNTVGGFWERLRQWPERQYEHYSIGYFAFHGRPGRLVLGRRSITIDQIAQALRGKCEGKMLYFGACSVLKIPKRDIQRFRRATKAECVVGFTRDVEWVASAALDVILLHALATHPRGVETEEWLRSEYGDLASHLGLRMIY
jgi:hypothetical protein